LTSDHGIEVRPVAPDKLSEPLSLLEEFLRDGEPVPSSFVEQLKRAVERGDLEVLAARAEPGIGLVGVTVLAYGLSVSSAGLFASIEYLYVTSHARRRGVGRTLLEAVGERCRTRGVSYIEVQTDDEAAPFYAALGYEPELGVRVLSLSYAL
jgi:GNAT superfamily N-acetyltransferase